MTWWPLSNMHEHDLHSHDLSLSTDRYVWMTPITRCCKAPHTLRAFSDHPSLLETIPDNITVIMLRYGRKKKKTPSEDCMVLQLRNQFLFILDKKKNQLEKERQSKVEKNNFFFIPEIPNGWCRRHSLLFMPVNNELHKSTWIQASMTLLRVAMLAVTGSPKDATGLSTFFLQKSRRAETSMAGNSSVWSFSKR